MIPVVHILARVLWKVAQQTLKVEQQSPEVAQVCSKVAQQKESADKT
jgi:hypothetical protein